MRSRSEFLGPWLVIAGATMAAMTYEAVSGHKISPRVSILRVLGLEFAMLGFWATYWLWIYPTYMSPFKQLPTPPQWYFLRGNRPVWFPPNVWDHILDLVRSVPNDGIMRYYGPTNLERLLVTSAEGARDLLVTNAKDFDHQSITQLAIKRMSGSELGSVATIEYLLHRKQLQPAFSVPHTRSLAPEFFRQARRMVSVIESQYYNKNPENPVPLHDFVYRATLDNVGLAGMGYDFNSLENPDSEVIHHYHKLAVEPTDAFNWIELASHYINFNWLLYIPLPKNMEVLVGGRFLRKLAKDIIEKRKEKIAAGKLGEHESKDIVSRAILDGGVIETRSDYLAHHVMTLLQGGHDSTSTAFQWIMYELGRHPEAQQRLRDEVREYMGPSLDEATGANIGDLPYLSAVLNETLRLYPFIPVMLREAVKDTSILGHHVPRGTIVSYSGYCTNRDEKMWGADADTWNPERWMAPGQSQRGGADTNYAFATFGHGPRRCLGQNFARVILPCLVAALVGRYRFHLVNGSETGVPKPGFRLVINSAWARLERVEGW